MTGIAVDGVRERGSHAALALALAVSAHVGLAWWLGTPALRPATAVAAGVGGLLIDLGPAGAAAGAPEPAEVPPDDVADPVEPPPVEAEAPVEEAVPEAPPEPAPEEIVEPVERVEPAPPVHKPPPPKPKPKAAPPRPQPQPKPQVRPQAAAQVAATQALPPARAQAAPVEGNQGVAGIGAVKDRGNSEAASGGGNPGAQRDYLALIQSWLERNKEYPRRARMRRQEGTVLLNFVIDRGGRVLDHRIVRPSGHGALDEEVLAMIRRAGPLPAMPPDVPGTTMAITVPIVFSLR